MRFFKYVIDGYVMGCGKGNMGEQITEAEYNNILAAIKTKPPRTETTDWRLRTDLTWEEYAVDPPDPDPEIDDNEAFQIILGGTP